MATTSAALDDDVATDASHQPAVLVAKPWVKLLQATKKMLAIGTRAAATTLLIQTACPRKLVRGSSLPGTALRTWAVYAAVRRLIRRRWRQPRSLQGPLDHSTTHSSALYLLELPSWPWLNEDAAIRLLAQSKGDVKHARDRAVITAAWREAQGMDLLFSAPPPASTALDKRPSLARSSSARLAAWLTTWPSRSPAYTLATVQPDTEALQGKPAVQAALRFKQMVPIVGVTLVHLDDARGLAVIWIKVALLSSARTGVSSLLSNCSGQLGGSSGQVGGWAQACALHMAIMSDWVWRIRMPGWPLAAGRSVQVFDLQGVRVASALSDSLAVSQAIMSDAQHFRQRLKACILVNPPHGLSLAWSMLSKLLPQPVAEKVKVVKGSSAATFKALREYLPDELIPHEYGGTSKLRMSQYPAHMELEAAMAGEAVRLTHP